MDDPFAPERNRMVQWQIEGRGVRDTRVLQAMREVRRHEFVPEVARALAYRDCPLAIGFGQTISQPYIVGWMSELLELQPGHRVLEVGAGCGYQTAVLARLCAEVFALERLDALTQMARANLERAGAANVQLRTGDGCLGWPEEAPFDAVLVAAASPMIPRALIEQLAPGGRLVIPLGSSEGQVMTRLSKDEQGETTREYLGEVAFVPLIPGEPG